MTDYKAPKGTFDILPIAPEKEPWRHAEKYAYLEEVLKETSIAYGYREIRTPIFEKTDLFIRGVGETSDIVTKEMYTFDDKASRSMSLRPEGTAPVIRAYLENRLDTQTTNTKVFYMGPFFRYDRPQAGRFRQFHQYGAEAIGIEGPEQDVEMIDMVCEMYRKLGLQKLHVMLNSIGDASTRPRYQDALREFLRPHFDELSEHSKHRFEKNPLRILDTKDQKEQELLGKAPKILDYLDEASNEHFQKLCGYLTKLKIPFTINHNLVRGLDYYGRTVFEVTSDVLGAQNTIGAGGRFDALIGDLGGAATPAIGFATGIERILLTMTGQNAFFPKPPSPFVYLIPMGEVAMERCLDLCLSLRHSGIPAELHMKKQKMQKALQTANAKKAKYVVVIGEDELQSGSLQLKDLESHTVDPCSIEGLKDEVTKRWKNHA